MSNTNASNTNTPRNKPVDEVRIGPVKAAVWANTNNDGQTRHSVTVSRSYQDAEGNWKDTTSFNASE